MNSRAWALTAMTCALLLGTPTTLADDGEVDLIPSFLDESTAVLEDACVSMLEVTMVSFGGNEHAIDSSQLDLSALVKGQLHTTITTIEEVYHYPADALTGLGAEDVLGPVFMELLTTTETIVEEVDIETPIHVAWEKYAIEWERVERDIRVPLPADLTSVAPEDIVTVCGDDSLTAEAPYHGDYDWVEVMWWPESMAPDVPETQEYISITELDIGTEFDATAEPVTLEEGLLLCPNPVADAVLDALAEYAPTIHNEVFPEEEEQESQVELPADSTPASNDEGKSLGTGAKASIGGALGISGLLGSLLALRRK